MAFSTRLHPSCSTTARGFAVQCVHRCALRVNHATATPGERCLVVVRASETQTGAEASSQSAPAGTEWVSVLSPEDLPKGVRKEIRVNGVSILLFWYRNQIYAIDARSPAEGAYSEGFIKAKFTQDYGIECPTTGSTFSLKDGSILDWYPSNPVLRAVTPRVGNMGVYPVKLTQDAIQVALGSGTAGLSTRGGADTSLENNNVFALQPQVYVAGSDSDSEASSAGLDVSTAATFSVAIAAFGIMAVAGTATALFLEDFVLLGGFWAVLLGAAGYFTFQYNSNKGN